MTKDDIRQRGLDSRHCAQLIERVSREFKLERRPFCAGFFAFSTDQIGPTVLDDLKTLTDRYGCISKFGDQLILNFYFYGHWQKLNPTFNVLVRQTNYHDAYERLSATETRWGGVNNLHPYILHIFDPKPWSPESSFYLEWYSNLLRADNVLPGEPPAVDPTSLDLSLIHI